MAFTDQDALAWLVPSTRHGVPLVDRMQRFCCTQPDARSLALSGRLQRGLYQGELETRTGAFAPESLMLSMREWPTRKRCLTGPFDFDHTRYKMAVPVLRVFVDGEDCGLVWCEVPSPRFVAAGRIRACWGFQVRRNGGHELRLELPQGEKRLRWQDLERLRLAPDDRCVLGLGPRFRRRLGRPRLFLDRRLLRALRSGREPVRAAMLRNLVGWLREGRDGTYAHRTVAAALAGLVLEKERWRREALERTLRLCERPYWGYHDEPEIMGWNNDRDAGMRMFETAVVYDWLHAHLDERQRRLIRERLAYQAELAQRVTILQKGYWYQRSNEAHGQGLWFGFAAAALALAGEVPVARQWLEWVNGNVLDALRHLPADGINVWPVFNVQWLILSTLLLERAMGRTYAEHIPFLENFAPSITRLPGGFGGGGEKLAPLLFGLAARNRDARAQAAALARVGLQAQDLAGRRRPLDPLGALLYDPRIEPASRPPRPALSTCSENGTVLCSDRRGRLHFSFFCGTPLTPRQHHAHNWNAMAWYGIRHAGGFGVRVGGHHRILPNVKTYRNQACSASVISIGASGHPLEGRYLGAAVNLEETPFIEHFAHAGGVTSCLANLAPAYTPTAGVQRLTRRWIFLHEQALLFMLDCVELCSPARISWHAPSPARWRHTGELAFQAGTGEDSLALRFLDAVEPEQPEPAARVRRLHYIPTYTQGMNKYKTLEWQPEIHGRNDPPDHWGLEARTRHPERRRRFLIVLGLPGSGLVQGASCRKSREALSVLLPGGARVSWPLRGSLRVGELKARIQAGAAVRLPAEGRTPDRWLFFDTKTWKRGSEDGECPVPRNLSWQVGAPAPVILRGQREPVVGTKTAG